MNIYSNAASPIVDSLFRLDRRCVDHSMRGIGVGVDRLSAPILSILPIIDIGHFQNRFADNLLLFFIIIMQTNILFTGDIIYWWINNTGEIIKILNALFGSMQPVWAQHSVRVRRSLNLWEQSPPTAHLICRESRVRPINAETEGSLTPKALANWSCLSQGSRISCLSKVKQQQTLLKLQ